MNPGLGKHQYRQDKVALSRSQEGRVRDPPLSSLISLATHIHQPFRGNGIVRRRGATRRELTNVPELDGVDLKLCFDDPRCPLACAEDVVLVHPVVRQITELVHLIEKAARVAAAEGRRGYG